MEAQLLEMVEKNSEIIEAKNLEAQNRSILNSEFQELKKENKSIREARELAIEKSEEEKQANAVIIENQKEHIHILASSIEALKEELENQERSIEALEKELENQQKSNKSQTDLILEQQGTIEQLLTTIQSSNASSSSSLETQNRESSNRIQNLTGGITTFNQFLSIIFWILW